MAQAGVNDIPVSLRNPSQVPTFPKEYFPNQAALINLGPNNNLAFTYYMGMVAYCAQERTRFEWREAPSVGDIGDGILPANFVYPAGLIVYGITYSNKPYNFFPVVLMQGDDGLSAYEIAVNNGFVGNELAWLASLQGPAGNGQDGDSAYEVAVANGFVGNEVAWLASLIGAAGASAYQVALNNGFVGNELAWLASLVGPAGQDASNNLQRVVTGSFTLANSDNNSEIIINNGAANINVTVPTGLMNNFNCGFIQKGTGDVAFVQSGTTILSDGGKKKIKGQEKQAYISKELATTTFHLLGNLKS